MSSWYYYRDIDYKISSYENCGQELYYALVSCNDDSDGELLPDCYSSAEAIHLAERYIDYLYVKQSAITDEIERL